MVSIGNLGLSHSADERSASRAILDFYVTCPLFTLSWRCSRSTRSDGFLAGAFGSWRRCWKSGVYGTTFQNCREEQNVRCHQWRRLKLRVMAKRSLSSFDLRKLFCQDDQVDLNSCWKFCDSLWTRTSLVNDVFGILKCQ